MQKIFNVANADSDKKAFNTLAMQNMAKLNISTKDSKFKDIATLQANIQALNAENKKLSAMTTIFATEQVKNYSNQITIFLMGWLSHRQLFSLIV